MYVKSFRIRSEKNEGNKEWFRLDEDGKIYVLGDEVTSEQLIEILEAGYAQMSWWSTGHKEIPDMELSGGRSRPNPQE
jgi:hypothetical protein